MSQLPDDLLPNIFSKLPLKSLFRFKCVCKLWFKIIDGQTLAEMHLNDGVEKPRILLISHSPGNPDETWRDDGRVVEISLRPLTALENSRAHLESHCNGILCFSKVVKPRSTFLLNPLKQQVLHLPLSKSVPHFFIQWQVYGLGFDATTKTYKVLRVFCVKNRSGSEEIVGAEVHTVGSSSKSSSWRAIRWDAPHWDLIGMPVYAGGYLYWGCLHQNVPEDFFGKIVAFHMGNEEFSFISSPDTGNIWFYHLFVLEGVLSLVDCSPEKVDIEIWVMQDHEKENWVKKYSVNVTSLMGSVDNMMLQVIGPWEHGEILMRYKSSFISYNPKTERLRYIHFPIYSDKTVLFSYIGSLVSLS